MVVSSRRKDIYQSYYTTCDYISSFMVSKLKLESNLTIFEPCAGDGEFIDEILKVSPSAVIEACEMNADAYKILKRKYGKFKNIKITNTDALLENDKTLFTKRYDRIIANPPYGAWQDMSRRALLREKYPSFYVKETYGLFLYRCINLLKDNGRLVFILPDTYLNLHQHKKLREFIINNTRVEQIVLFPSKFFPGVSFGYAGLSIITLVKETIVKKEDSVIEIVKNLKKPEDLTLLDGNIYDINKTYINTKNVINNPDYAFIMANNDTIGELLCMPKCTIGDIADVVTGFYSGNDKLYLRRLESINRGKDKYAAVSLDQICYDADKQDNSLEGIETSKHWVPIVKGGSKEYYKPSEWFIDWSVDAIYQYKVANKKKARFQNSQYYFKEGIAVPMVSSRRITAALLEKRLFDQSIVGIFPHSQQFLYYLLGFFNSEICNKLIRLINPSANNSANYLKKIPFIMPDNAIFNSITNIVSQLYTDLKNGNNKDMGKINELNSLYGGIYNID